MKKLSDIVKNLKNDTNFETKRKLDTLVSFSSRYKNIDKNDKKIILDILKKYEKYLDDGKSVSSFMIKRDRYRLYSHREKLGLSELDLEQINKLLNSFKK